MQVRGGRRMREGDSGHPRASPLVSVVTVVYNGAADLALTIDSVLALHDDTIEYIVIDGGSTDGTQDILHGYGDCIDLWISERDAGIYDAMNKGIALATGRFVLHLNIGDLLLGLPQLLTSGVADDVACVTAAVRTSPTEVHIPSAGAALRFHNTMHHQGCFYRRTPELRYDLQYQVFSDFDFNQKLLLSGRRIVVSPEIVAVHGVEGVSHTTNRFFEVYRIVHSNFGTAWLIACFAYFKYRGLRRRLGLL